MLACNLIIKKYDHNSNNLSNNHRSRLISKKKTWKEILAKKKNKKTKIEESCQLNFSKKYRIGKFNKIFL